MTILLTGDYDANYNRTKILLDGLKLQKDINLEFYPVKSYKEFYHADFKRALDVCDFVFLPAFTHKYVKPLRKLSSKPIIFDPLISKYLTKVFDYKKISKYSPRAYKNYLKDKIAFRNCDILIADTQGHKDYFVRTFNLKESLVHVLPIGVQTDDFPVSNFGENRILEVGFYGGFIPLQGTMNILKAAEILRYRSDIHFTLIGTGYEWERAKQFVKARNLTSVEFTGWVPADDLPAAIGRFDICLGIFGDTAKADMVIPNKIFHYAAVQKPVITKNTPAIREIFTNEKDIFLCGNNPRDIADFVIKLADNQLLRVDLAKSASDLVRQSYNHIKTAQRFTEILSRL